MVACETNGISGNGHIGESGVEFVQSLRHMRSTTGVPGCRVRKDVVRKR
jgi:hypothetical protein